MFLLDMETVKELLLFCKANSIHHIELGELKADLVPDTPKSDEPVDDKTAPNASSLPNWLNME